MKYTLNVPTEIYRGENVIDSNYNIFKELGKVSLIVTGNKSTKLNGSLGDLLTALDLCEIEYYIFDKVIENPSLDIVEAGAKFGKKYNVDFVIGIGGGSAIDAAKAISVMLTQKTEDSRILFSDGNLSNLPLVAIPTTSGTGSEVTGYSILTDHKRENKRKIKREIFPDFSFIDWRYTKSLDENLRKNTALDAFTHLVEGYLNSNATKETDALAIKGLKMFSECLEGVSKGKLNDFELEKLSEVSTIGGVLISINGTTMPHCMGYPLTYYKGLPHGVATACLYPGYLESFKEAKKVRNIINILGFTSLKDLQKVIIRLTLNNIIVSEDELTEYSKKVLEDKRRLKNHPEIVEYEDIYKIYYNSLIGKHRKF
ncbi:iron-containing alcohol dehydrogenase family protein [Clostridium chrysemydis]|uniref:iron-containing alcohol dehydrogenase family protein n=1 Tax=Clostridium chrysemydis TaxID=2665504 RepID=UPI003F304ABA